MHDIDRTQLEAAEGYRSPHSDEFVPGSGEFGEAGRFGEQQETEGLSAGHSADDVDTAIAALDHAAGSTNRLVSARE
jgi:hypothetical protein